MLPSYKKMFFVYHAKNRPVFKVINSSFSIPVRRTHLFLLVPGWTNWAAVIRKPFKHCNIIFYKREMKFVEASNPRRWVVSWYHQVLLEFIVYLELSIIVLESKKVFGYEGDSNICARQCGDSFDCIIYKLRVSRRCRDTAHWKLNDTLLITASVAGRSVWSIFISNRGYLVTFI